MGIVVHSGKPHFVYGSHHVPVVQADPEREHDRESPEQEEKRQRRGDKQIPGNNAPLGVPNLESVAQQHDALRGERFLCLHPLRDDGVAVLKPLCPGQPVDPPHHKKTAWSCLCRMSVTSDTPGMIGCGRAVSWMACMNGRKKSSLSRSARASWSLSRDGMMLNLVDMNSPCGEAWPGPLGLLTHSRKSQLASEFLVRLSTPPQPVVGQRNACGSSRAYGNRTDANVLKAVGENPIAVALLASWRPRTSPRCRT